MRKTREIIEHSTGSTVRIDDFFKDDPKMLAELAEIRKWMDENPELFNFSEEQRTQGQLKMKQLLEDVRRNKKFAKAIERVAGLKSSPERIHDLEMLYFLYRSFLDGMEKFRKKHLLKDAHSKLARRICREYGIDPVLFDRLVHAFKNNRLEGWDFNEDSSLDICIIEKSKDQYLPIDIHEFHVTSVEGIEEEVYPLKIKIHRFASKRDILDFIEKKWETIQPHLYKKRIRQRKLSREITDFIWKHREEKAKRIQQLLKEKFPKSRTPLYFEINKLINEEKKRRSAK